MIRSITLAAAALAIVTTCAQAQKFTRQQQEAACSDDAFALCQPAMPDEQKVMACMIANRTKLSPRCRYVFDASYAEQAPPARR